jgi:chromosome segregation ATPase
MDSPDVVTVPTLWGEFGGRVHRHRACRRFLGMEGSVKGKQAFLHYAIALTLLAGLAGCKDDSTAVNALEELTTQLSDQVAEQNKELSSLTEGLQTCMKDLATAKGEAVVIESSDATVEVPSLEGEATAASLEALKQALNETVEKQKGLLTELKAKNEQCTKDVQAAQEAADAEATAAAEAEAAAAAEAEAEAAAKKAAAKKRAASKKKTVERSEAGQQRESEGRPATGVGSRHQKR